MRVLSTAVSFVAVGLLARTAFAHAVDLSQSDFVVQPSGVVHATLLFARADAGRLAILPPGDPRQAGPPAAERWPADGGAAVWSDGRACSNLLAESRFVESDGVELTLDFACAPPSRTVRVDVPLLGRLPPGHRHAARVTTAGGSVDALLTSSSYGLVYTMPPAGSDASRRGAGSTFVTAVRLGFEHVVTGWDHLLFLCALLLGLRGARAVVAAATAFTVGHSITLALAALAVFAPSPRFVEPAIAASIACVALQNLGARPPRHRWPIAFVFGLVHGLGFAAALRNLAMARERLVPTLLGFNIGVELAQAFVVLLALSLYALAAVACLAPQLRGSVDGPPLRWASVVLAAVGGTLCVLRIVAP